MIVLDITDSSFINSVDSTEGDDWMKENIGELVYDSIDGSRTVGTGWKIYFVQRLEHEDHGHWYAEFENEAHASLFMLRWS